MEPNNNSTDKNYLEVIAKLINVIIILLIVIVLLAVLHFTGSPGKEKRIIAKNISTEKSSADPVEKNSTHWTAPDSSEIKNEPNAELIHYGKKLIANTSFYLGPQGTIGKTSNGMNCQNCHLQAGTKPFGNNYSAVASTYPKFRERSGSIESVCKRVNDCIERSLNGKGLDSSSTEMKAFIAYISWVGKNVPRGKKPEGAGLLELSYLDRPADPVSGKVVYNLKCKRCHEENGDGKLNANGLGYQYPPLWGDNSYNNGAGLYRLSRFAAYVKSNMPEGVTFENPQLSDEEAWDVAAFVNSQPRPQKNLKKDWPNISRKPIDHPYGPYADTFSEKQHKYGPFEPIAALKSKKPTSR